MFSILKKNKFNDRRNFIDYSYKLKLFGLAFSLVLVSVFHF